MDDKSGKRTSRKRSNPQPGGRGGGRPRPPIPINIEIKKAHRKILAIIQTKGRISIKDLAAEVGLTAPRCGQYLKELEDAGIIDGYMAVINLDRLEKLYPPAEHIAMVSVHVTLSDHRQEKEFIEFLKTMDGATECSYLDGIVDFEIKFSCMTRRHYNDLREEMIEKFPAMSLVSHPAFPKFYKLVPRCPIDISRP